MKLTIDDLSKPACTYIRVGDKVSFKDISNKSGIIYTGDYLGIQGFENARMTFLVEGVVVKVFKEYCYDALEENRLKDDGYGILLEELKLYNDRTNRRMKLVDE